MYSVGEHQKAFNLHNHPISEDVWSLKYKRKSESSISDTIARVVDGVLGSSHVDNPVTYDLMFDGVFLPGGRILAGAGLPEHDSTLMNCYCMGVLDDSLEGIMDCLRESAFTAKFGGGIGIDFSPLRPKGSPIKTAAYFAGGPVAFMGLWDAMGHAMEAGGNRRGGKMGVLRIDHPDILEFIEAKVKGGKLSGFNISVLVPDTFMQAVKDDGWWYFVHDAAPKEIVAYEDGPSSVDGYIWGRTKARELWNKILHTTYMYSEPGVLFIDRINYWNPLNYREMIYTTNPCGEQPLPPYGACNLGSINLARCVLDPFKATAKVNYDLIKEATRIGIKFLDKVLDVTKYPLDEQYIEASKVRRIGLGITGLADLLAQLMIPYDSEDGVRTASIIMGTITNEAYKTSAQLSKEYGPFPDYHPTKHQEGIFFKRLAPGTQDLIKEHGLRNGLLISIAPTGTISTVFGDVSSGCEPHFDHCMTRKIKVKDENHNDTWADYRAYSYAVRMAAQVSFNGNVERAYDYITDSELYPTAQNISVAAHTDMVGALQYWVDSAISKTTNCPTYMTFEEFQAVYENAYSQGCKGCTTYRHREDMGAVLIADKKSKNPEECRHEASTMASPINQDYKRGFVLSGKTYKLRWPDLPSPVFVTINHDEFGHPIELFIASKNALHNEWTVALSVLCSKLLQVGTPLKVVAEQLKQITLSTSTAYDNGRHYGSLVSRIGWLLEEHDALASEPGPWTKPTTSITVQVKLDTSELLKDIEEVQDAVAKICRFCGSRNTRVSEGCLKCDDCGQSKCD